MKHGVYYGLLKGQTSGY